MVVSPFLQVVRRFAALLPLWLAIDLLAFVIGHLAPGDPAQATLSAELGRPPTNAELAHFRHALGLDQSLAVQYLHSVVSALHGDLGTSYATGASVADTLFARLPATLVLATGALVVGASVGVPLGVLAARTAGTTTDALLRGASVGLASLPNFALGYLLIVAFAVDANLLPAQGTEGPSSLVLPTIALALPIAGVVLRIVRAAVLSVLEDDHVRTARAKGLRERQVVLRHVLRNALNPVVTYLGLVYGELLAGAVVVESVFAWQGIGLTVTQAITARDYPVVQGFVLVAGTIFLLVNLAVDVIYVVLDPRLRLGAAAR